jgi:tripartite-type tricarboxylate transporter receptor subunit TctC
VVIENKPGGNGSVSVAALMSSPPDGTSFIVQDGSIYAINPHIYAKMAYSIGDLTPTTMIAQAPLFLAVHQKVPVKTMKEFIDYVKANPGKLNYGSSGVGGLTHYSVELFQARTGTKAVHIPFKGGAQSTAAVLAGEVDFSFANMTDALPQIEAGLVRGLAVTSLDRSPYFPDLPSVHETIIPNFLVETWNAIIAPPKTSEPIIRKMSEILLKMADDPEAKETMRKAGANTVKTTPEQFRAQIQQEMAQWQPLIKEIAEKK